MEFGAGAYGCEVPSNITKDVLGLSVRVGCNALGKLHSETRKNPWWAITSCVFHAGTIDYNTQQPLIDRIVSLGPKFAYDRKAGETLESAYVEGMKRLARLCAVMPISPQFWQSRISMLVVASRVYQEIVGAPGSEFANKATSDQATRVDLVRTMTEGFALDSRDLISLLYARPEMFLPGYKFSMGAKLTQAYRSAQRAAMLESIGLPSNYFETPFNGLGLFEEYNAPARNDATNLGAKTQDLLLEYLGDPNAIAADRHVTYWAARAAYYFNGGKSIIPKRIKMEDLQRPYDPVFNRKYQDKKGGPLKVGMATPYYHKVLGYAAPSAKAAKNANNLKAIVDPFRTDFQNFRRDDLIDYPFTFSAVKQAIQRLGAQEGVSPAAIQVAAWAFGVCTSAQGEDKIYLGKGATFYCKNEFRQLVQDEKATTPPRIYLLDNPRDRAAYEKLESSLYERYTNKKGKPARRAIKQNPNKDEPWFGGRNRFKGDERYLEFSEKLEANKERYRIVGKALRDSSRGTDDDAVYMGEEGFTLGE